MIRKAFLMELKPGHEREYIARHAAIWPELEQALKEHGAHNYSIHLLPETCLLFAYIEIEDETRWAGIARTEVCQRWWRYMEELMVSHSDHTPKVTSLREVFYLE